jgi:hypothetical protein
MPTPEKRQIVSFGLFWQRQNHFDARCAESAGRSGKCSSSRLTVLVIWDDFFSDFVLTIAYHAAGL